MMFRGTLDDDMFITLKEKGTSETDAKGLLQIPYEFAHKYEHLVSSQIFTFYELARSFI